MILVTGATGLVGTHLVYQLLMQGKSVRALYREASKFSLVKQLLEFYAPGKELFDCIEWVKCDILDVISLEEAFEGVEQVYHCAAKVSFNPKDKKILNKVNIEGTANVVNVSLHVGVQKLCYVSSTSALGTSMGTITENTPWENNPNPSNYSYSKYHAENEVWRGMEEGLDAVIVNPSMIVGPGDWNYGSAAVFKRVWEGLNFYTEGSNGFVDVRDVTKCMIGLMDSAIVNERFLLVGENLPFRIFFDHIATNLERAEATFKVSPYLTQLAWRVEQIRTFFTGSEPVITEESARIAMKKELYSNKKIIQALGVEFTPIRQAIEHTCMLFKMDLHKL